MFTTVIRINTFLHQFLINNINKYFLGRNFTDNNSKDSIGDFYFITTTIGFPIVYTTTPLQTKRCLSRLYIYILQNLKLMQYPNIF